MLFIASLQSYYYGITLFQLISYILSIFLGHNIYRFCCYNRKKVKFIFCFGETLFLRFDWLYSSIYLKSLYESYLPLSTSFLIFVFNHPIQNKLLPLHTIVALVVSNNGLLLFVSFVASLQTDNYGITFFLLTSST